MEGQRYYGRNSGFSLVELLAVVGIFSLLITIATLAFSKMITKESIEKQMKMLYADFMEVRSRSLYERLPQTIKLTPSQLTVYSGVKTTAAPIFTRVLQHPVAWSGKDAVLVIEYDSFGVTDDPVTICIDPTEENSASTDSLCISRTRIRLGKRKANRPCGADYVKLK